MILMDGNQDSTGTKGDKKQESRALMAGASTELRVTRFRLAANFLARRARASTEL